MKRLLCAEWVAPMDQPILRPGAVVLDGGRILAVGPAASLRQAHPGAAVEHLGQSVLLPGLVNAHTHLELSDARPNPPPAGGFAAWLLQIIARAPNDPAHHQRAIESATRSGIDQCLRFGITSVGDITRQPQWTRPILSASPLRVTSYGEVQAMAQRRSLLEPRLAAATESSCATERLVIGLSPHAPYSIEPAGYERCLAEARQRGLPLATHLAESPHEADFLSHHAGPFRQLWDTLAAWDDRVPRFAGGPIRLAQELGLLDHPTLLAHVNYCDDEDLAFLARGQASVVYCPRTHAYFGHPPHRWRQMLDRGINVALGTDSCASSPDLNLVDDLRFVHKLDPQADVRILWEMATIRAARALQRESEIGSLTPGKRADLIAFPAAGRDPLRHIFAGSTLPSHVWIGGQLIRKENR